jgi:Ca2+-binding RTX toxin-like protein
MGGDGQDFINGGANDNESFAGPGNDFIIAGQGADAVFGDGGDDWIQGGSGQDLLQGDHGAPFFDDPAESKPGNDVFVGQTGENDYDAEGGDDLMAQDPAIDRNAGAGGFDWAFHQYDTVSSNTSTTTGTDDDMQINNQLVGVPIQVVVNRDRWQETEADSGSAFDDTIRGTDDAPGDLGGAGFTGCDALDPAGVNRIGGLAALLPTGAAEFPRALSSLVTNAAAGDCPLTGAGATATDRGNVWAEGNIILGGAGSDSLMGRGANDIIDGDKALFVRISVRANPDGTGAELGTTDLMENKATSGDFGLGTAGMTLQQAVFAGKVDPGQLVIVREIRSPAPASVDCGAPHPANCDTAVFGAPRLDANGAPNYTITPNADGSVTVTQIGARVAPQKVDDGTDTCPEPRASLVEPPARRSQVVRMIPVTANAGLRDLYQPAFRGARAWPVFHAL